MATNADDILNGSAVGAAAKVSANEDYLEKHFEEAGVGKETVDDTTGQNTDTASGDTSGEKAGGKQAADAGVGNGNTKDGDPKPAPNAEGAKKEGTDQPTNGDLKLPDGTVIKAGTERRLYEQYNVSRQENAVLKNQVQQLTQNRDQWKQKHLQLEQTVQTTHGASPQAVKLGVQMFNDLQRDPIGTVKKLVAEAVAAGHTIEQLGTGLNAEVLAIVNRNIQANQQQQTQQGPSEQEILAAAQAEVNSFYTQFPDARVHDDLLGRVLADHPQLTVTEAYFGLKSQFAKNGLDWSKSLESQMPSGGQQPQQQQQRQMPTGRHVVDPATADKVTIAHESLDNGDIVKMAMREAGLNI